MSKCQVCGKPIDQESVRSGDSQTSGGMSVVNPQQGTRQLHEGKWYYFCGIECRTKFMGTPEQYIEN